MKVTLIAHTAFHPSNELLDSLRWEPNAYGDADALAEFAGRACYQSWPRPNPATATSEGYHANTLSQGHYSIYEHASFTFYIEGVSRALTHELIRHRHLSFSQLSQRFVAEDTRVAEPVIPPAIKGDFCAEHALRAAYASARENYEVLVERLLEKGLSRKQAREAARAVLPNCQETKLVVTGNVRAWREFIQKRNTPHADAEIQQLARGILGHLKRWAPASVQDITDEGEAQ